VDIRRKGKGKSRARDGIHEGTKSQGKLKGREGYKGREESGELKRVKVER
jgi:hypothetical protein